MLAERIAPVRKVTRGIDALFALVRIGVLLGVGLLLKLVEPGYCPTTRFAENGAGRMNGLIPDAYADFARPIFEAFSRPQATTQPLDVAEAVWQAAHDASDQLHFPAGADAVALAGPR